MTLTVFPSLIRRGTFLLFQVVTKTGEKDAVVSVKTTYNVPRIDDDYDPHFLSRGDYERFSALHPPLSSSIAPHTLRGSQSWQASSTPYRR